MEETVEAFRSLFSLLFLSFAAAFFLLALVLKALRSMPWWCSCPVCEAYVTKSWTAHFDNLCDWYAHLLRESPTRTIHIHVLGNTVTANPDNVEHMLRARFDNYPKGKTFSAILGDLLGRGIFNVDGHLWRFQRKMAGAELGSSAVRFFASCIVADEVRGRFLPLLDVSSADDKILDLQDVFRRFAFDNICKISFGIDPGCLELSLPMSEFAAAFDKASRLSASRATSTMPMVWKAKRLLNRGSERELREAIGMVNLLANELIRQRRKIGFSSNHDLLSRFMACVDDEKYLRDIIISFMLAGRDTVASLWGSDCHEFRPQRWLTNGAFTPESPYKYPVFQGGLRVCLGKDMALMEMKTVIVAVVRRFDIHVVDDGSSLPPKFAPGLTASLEGGLPVRVKRRDTSFPTQQLGACSAQCSSIC
uniref:Cytochrome P450 family protein n=1 Tax=Musa acuminata subsp. malaccensis TaxID=214687 RepID=A0A804LBI6_MUSAM